MQKRFSLIIILILALTLTACATNSATSSVPGETSQSAEATAVPAGIPTDYGSSELYTEEDMDAAIQRIMQEFSTWEGCEMHAIRYTSDDANNTENLQWLNSLGNGHTFTQCIEFQSDFHSPKEAYGAWEADKEYTDWQWWLGRSEGGDWYLVSWGY